MLLESDDYAKWFENYYLPQSCELFCIINASMRFNYAFLYKYILTVEIICIQFCLQKLLEKKNSIFYNSKMYLYFYSYLFLFIIFIHI